MSKGRGGSGGGSAPSAPSAQKLGLNAAKQNASPSPATRPVSRTDLKPGADASVNAAAQSLKSHSVAPTDSTAPNTAGAKSSNPTQLARGKSVSDGGRSL